MLTNLHKCQGHIVKDLILLFVNSLIETQSIQILLLLIKHVSTVYQYLVFVWAVRQLDQGNIDIEQLLLVVLHIGIVSPLVCLLVFLLNTLLEDIA